MKPERGIMNLLILAEIVILVTALVLGTVKKLQPKEEPLNYVAASTEEDDNSITPMFADTEAPEDIALSTTAGELTEQSTFSEEVQAKLSSMSLEAKVAQLFLTSPEALTEQDRVTIAGPGTQSALGEFPVGGLVYSRDNFQGKGQFGALLSGAQRFSREQSGEYLLLAARGSDAAGTAVTMLSGLYDVRPMVGVIEAEQLPGEAESMIYPAVFTGEQESVEAAYLIMGNTAADEITGEAGMPCSVSDGAMRHLRNTLGYQGLIMTGNLSDETITASYPDGKAAVMAVRAGADIIYLTEDFKKAYQAVLDAVNAGEISMERIDHAVGHILTQKENMPAPMEGDIIAENSETEEKPNNSNKRKPAENTADAGAANQDNVGADVAQQGQQNTHQNNNQQNNNNNNNNNQQKPEENGNNDGEQPPANPPQDNGNNGGGQPPANPPQEKPAEPPQDNNNSGTDKPAEPPQDNNNQDNNNAGDAGNTENNGNAGTPGTESVNTEN